MTLASGGQINRTITQSVPTAAPAGNYTYWGHCGFYPGVVLAESSFPFTKSAFYDGNRIASNWNLYGWEEELAEKDTLPNNCLLNPAYPNPFNNTTTISFNLAQSAKVDLAVFDLQGRLITQLAEDVYSPGTHRITVDASGLSSGIYFVRVLSGKVSMTEKLLLQK
jgi:hypothetical protein